MATKNVNAWHSQLGYIWAMVGSAVGFANILSFSARCYKNGGAAFLIPLFVAVIILGIPLLMLEGVIGQCLQLPLVCAYGKVAGKTGKFFGWMATLGVLTIGSYYTVINAWTVAYIYYAGCGKIPSDTAAFFSQTFLQDSGSLSSIGSISIPIIFFIMLVNLFTWFITDQSIANGIEKICSIFLPMLFILLIGFAFFVSFLPGAWTGFYYYLVPDLAKIADPQLWLSSFGHVFFSFSVGLAIIVGYSRYTDESVDIGRAMFWVAVGDILISVISGFVIFGGIGYMANVMNVAFDQVAITSTFGLGFVVFPQVFLTFHPLLKILFGTLFFFCLFIAGITGLFSIVEAVAGNIEVEFNWSRHKSVTVTVIAITILSFLYSAGNGSYIMSALDAMTAGFNVIISGIAQILIFMYLSSEVIAHPVWFYLPDRRSFSYYALKYISPLVLISILISSFMQEIKTEFGTAELVHWGWFVVIIVLSFILACRKDTQVSV